MNGECGGSGALVCGLGAGVLGIGCSLWAKGKLVGQVWAGLKAHATSSLCGGYRERTAFIEVGGEGQLA